MEKKTENKVTVNEVIGMLIIATITAFIWMFAVIISVKVNDINFTKLNFAEIQAYGTCWSFAYFVMLGLIIELLNSFDIDLTDLALKLRR